MKRNAPSPAAVPVPVPVPEPAEPGAVELEDAAGPAGGGDVADRVDAAPYPGLAPVALLLRIAALPAPVFPLSFFPLFFCCLSFFARAFCSSVSRSAAPHPLRELNRAPPDAVLPLRPPDRP